MHWEIDPCAVIRYDFGCGTSTNQIPLHRIVTSISVHLGRGPIGYCSSQSHHFTIPIPIEGDVNTMAVDNGKLRPTCIRLIPDQSCLASDFDADINELVATFAQIIDYGELYFAWLLQLRT